jgi:hypothetical protein
MARAASISANSTEALQGSSGIWTPSTPTCASWKPLRRSAIADFPRPRSPPSTRPGSPVSLRVSSLTWTLLETNPLTTHGSSGGGQWLRSADLSKTSTPYERKSRCFVVTVDETQVLPVVWGLQLGNIVHNLRSSLDHLAWAVVARGRRPPTVLTEGQQSGVMFPISATVAAFRAQLARRLPGARRDDVTRIRRAQPFRDPETARPIGVAPADMHPLSILQRLSNADKHRSIQPVLATPHVGRWSYRTLKTARSHESVAGDASRSK